MGNPHYDYMVSRELIPHVHLFPRLKRHLQKKRVLLHQFTLLSIKGMEARSGTESYCCRQCTGIDEPVFSGTMSTRKQKAGAADV